MAFRLSTGLRESVLGRRLAKTHDDDGAITFADANPDTIGITGIGSYFRVGDKVVINDSTTNDGSFPITAVAADLITTSGSLTAESSVAGTEVSAQGRSVADVFDEATLSIYTGTQPATADAVTSGTLLATFTGLDFGSVTTATNTSTLGKEGTWSTTAEAAIGTQTAGWFRITENGGSVTAASTKLARADGAIATSGAELNMANTSITQSGTVSIDTVAIPLSMT